MQIICIVHILQANLIIHAKVTLVVHYIFVKTQEKRKCMKITRLALELMLQFPTGKKLDFPVGGYFKNFSSSCNTYKLH